MEQKLSSVVFVAFRAATYAALFIGFFLVFLPRQIIHAAGMVRPAIGPWQIVGMVLTGTGALVALACVGAFAFNGRGTPFPLDPPRRLVVRGPYRWIRNPMYAGAVFALLGAAVFYQLWSLAEYAVLFLALAHVLVVTYEEPNLRRTFGEDYESYCRQTGRWWPRLR